MDKRWTKANDEIVQKFNKGSVTFTKLDLDKMDLNISTQGLQDAFLATGQTSAIPYGFVVPKTVTKNGVTYREKAVWVDPKHELNGGVYVHELLHVYSWPLPIRDRSDLSEGLAEFFTRQVNWTYANRAYNRQVTIIEDFIKKNGCESGLQKWFFLNRPEGITKMLGETFVKWRYNRK